MMSPFDCCGIGDPQTAAGAVTVVVEGDGPAGEQPQTVVEIVTDEAGDVVDIEVVELSEVL